MCYHARKSSSGSVATHNLLWIYELTFLVELLHSWRVNSTFQNFFVTQLPFPTNMKPMTFCMKGWTIFESLMETIFWHIHNERILCPLLKRNCKIFNPDGSTRDSRHVFFWLLNRNHLLDCDGILACPCSGRRWGHPWTHRLAALSWGRLSVHATSSPLEGWTSHRRWGHPLSIDPP